MRTEFAGELMIEDPSRDDASLLQLLMLGDGALSVGETWRSEAYGSKQQAPCATFRRSPATRTM